MPAIRFTILQLLLASALVALVLGLFTSAWRVASQQQIRSVCFSPSGRYLAAQYSSGAVQVWRLDERGPKAIALLAPRRRFGNDRSSLHFVSDDRLLRLNFEYVERAVVLEAFDLPTRRITEIAQLGDPLVAWGLEHGVTAEYLLLNDYNNGGLILHRFNDGHETTIATGRRVIDVTVSEDGQRVAVSDGDLVEVIDVNSGEALFRLGLDRVSASMAFTRHGELLVFDRYPSSQSLAAVAFCAVDRGDVRMFNPRLDEVRWVAVSHDGSRLALGSDFEIDVYDLTDGDRRLCRIHPDAYPYFSRDRAAFSPDGKAVAVVSRGQITLWDATTGDLRHTIAGGSRAVQIAIFTLGFSLWAAAWGLVRKDARRRQRAAQVSSPAVSQPTSPTIPAPWSNAMSPDKSALIGMAIVVVFIAVGTVAAFWDHVILPHVGNEMAIFAVLLFLGLILLGPLLALLHGWAYGPRSARQHAPSDASPERPPREAALARLRRLMRDEGRLHTFGELQVWCSGRSYSEPHFRRGYEEVTRHAEQLFGQPVRFQRPTLVAVLDRQADYDAFFGGPVIPAALAWADGVVVICEEAVLAEIAHPAGAYRSVLALLLQIQHKGSKLPDRVTLAVTMQLIRDQDYPLHLRGTVRRMKALWQRRPDWDPRIALLRPDAERERLWLAIDDGQARRAMVADSDFIIAAGEILLGDAALPQRREAALRWLRQLQPEDDPLAALERECGLSIDELIAECRCWLDEQPAGQYDPMPRFKQHILRTVVEPRLLRDDLPSAVRQRAVRQLYGCDYVAAAEPLLRLIDQPDTALRSEVVTVLECLSGQALGDVPARWPAWWDALPAGVKPACKATTGPGADEPAMATVPGPSLPEITAVPTSPPLALQLCWILMTLGGLLAVLLLVSFLFFAGPLVFPTVYLALFVGVAAIARGAARDTHGLNGTALLQALSLIACDPLNPILAACEFGLMQRADVQQYLRWASERPAQNVAAAAGE